MPIFYTTETDMPTLADKEGGEEEGVDKTQVDKVAEKEEEAMEEKEELGDSIE